MAAGRLRESAGEPELSDAYVTLLVHAAIAASDAICAKATGRYSTSGDHQDAVRLLRQVDPELEKHLSRALGVKTKAGYSAQRVSPTDVKQVERAVEALLTATERR